MYSCFNYDKSNSQDGCTDDIRRRWSVKYSGFQCFCPFVNPYILMPECLTMGNDYGLWRICKILHFIVGNMCHSYRHAVTFRRAAITFNGQYERGFSSAIALCHTYATRAEHQQYQHSKRYCYFGEYLHSVCKSTHFFSLDNNTTKNHSSLLYVTAFFCICVPAVVSL